MMLQKTSVHKVIYYNEWKRNYVQNKFVLFFSIVHHTVLKVWCKRVHIIKGLLSGNINWSPNQIKRCVHSKERLLCNFLVKTSFYWNPEEEVRVVLKMVKMFENACLKETESVKKCIKTDLSDWKKRYEDIL